jgi:hypothetical protein
VKGKKRTAHIDKDRSGNYETGAVIDEPSFDLFNTIVNGMEDGAENKSIKAESEHLFEEPKTAPESMRRKMFALVKEAGLEASEAKEIIKEKFGKDSSTKLTIQEMTQLLDYLQNKKEEVA